MLFESFGSVRLVLPRNALLAIFDECDRYEQDETGGRVIGTYSERGGKLTIQVTGIIGPGARASRSPTSFYQDGEEQEHIFRQIEQHHHEIEHLGNWHTHHVNGLQTLSSGDITTYQRIVNHSQHNTSFFYALLVVAQHRNAKPHERYSVKHYLLRRNDRRVYEIPSRRVELIDMPLMSPEVASERKKSSEPTAAVMSGVKPERVYDRDILSEFYRGLHPYTSKRLGVYWRGPIELIDGSHVEVIVLEGNPAQSVYSVALRDPPASLKPVAEELAQREFPSARAALITAERIYNRELYVQLRRPQQQDVVQEEE